MDGTDGNDRTEHDEKLVNACKDDDVAAALDALRNGADPNVALPDGSSALKFACANDNPQLVALLLRAGASPNPESSSGQRTALHLAAFLANEANVLMLLSAGADLNARDSHGHTPSEGLYEPSSGAVLKILREAANWPPAASRSHYRQSYQDRVAPKSREISDRQP